MFFDEGGEIRYMVFLVFLKHTPELPAVFTVVRVADVIILDSPETLVFLNELFH